MRLYKIKYERGHWCLYDARGRLIALASQRMRLANKGPWAYNNNTTQTETDAGNTQEHTL